MLIFSTRKTSNQPVPLLINSLSNTEQTSGLNFMNSGFPNRRLPTAPTHNCYTRQQLSVKLELGAQLWKIDLWPTFADFG